MVDIVRHKLVSLYSFKVYILSLPKFLQPPGYRVSPTSGVAARSLAGLEPALLLGLDLSLVHWWGFQPLCPWFSDQSS